MAIILRKNAIAVMLSTTAIMITNVQVCSAFSLPIFTEQKAMQRTTPSKTEGVEIELPDFDELFGRIQDVSPLARMSIEGEEGGLDVADQKCKFFVPSYTYEVVRIIDTSCNRKLNPYHSHCHDFLLTIYTHS